MTLFNCSSRWSVLLLVVWMASVVPPASNPLWADDAKPIEWTLDDALEQLRLYPQDPYLQYVVLQMARDTDRFHAVSQEVESMVGRWNPGRRQGPQNVHAFGIFSGALAIQESLQLDRLTAETNPPAEARQGAANIPVASLTGPTIKSHPWDEMLAGQKPDVSRLAQCVPADFFFVEAASVTKLLELKAAADLWGQHAFTQSTQSARSQTSVDQILNQLALDADDPLRSFYDAAVSRIAITGSDLFFRSGTDVSLLFEVKQPLLFRARMELFLQSAGQHHPDAVRSEGTLHGVPYTQLSTPDRRIHVFQAEMQPNLFVCSNSLTALQRLVESSRGQDERGREVESLGQTLEFQYIRTLMETGAEDEDVFVYLSDPFIRRLVGPQLKLTVLRRMQCYNHMRMVGHACLLYRTQFGKQPESIEQLVASGCAPKDFGARATACPDGGQYSLSGATSCSCSHHGHAQSMVPCLEIPVAKVTEQEANAYNTFLEQYNQYWRRFFDPIALQIKISPQQYRVETIILPLIDNTLYSGLALAFNGPPESLDVGPVPRRTIFTTSARLNKTALAWTMGFAPLLDSAEGEPQESSQRNVANVAAKLRQLGIAMHNHHDAYRSLPPRATDEGHALLSWRVHLLPFVGQQALYEQFHLDEPWDSPHNKTLIEKMPDIYRSDDPALNAAGKTLLMQPAGEQMMHPRGEAARRFRDIRDGLSNTIMLLEASADNAEIWTRPADLPIDVNHPLAELKIHPPGGFVALFADGSVHFFRNSMSADTVAAMLTINGREAVADPAADELPLQLPPQRNGRNRSYQMYQELQQMGVGEFVMHGIGNQISLNLYDGDPLVGFSTLEFLGEAIRGMSRGRAIDGDWVMLTPLIASINSPVYLSIPVQDAKIVDNFLERLDVWVAKHTRQNRQRDSFLRIEQGFYRWNAAADVQPRAITLRFGPITFRFFWTRIGDTLYIASKPFILEDLAALAVPSKAAAASESDPEPQATSAAHDAAHDAAHGHAMIRIRPEQWDQVLPSFHLGWAEAQREACLSNLGPLSSVQRAIASSSSADQEHSDDGRARERLATEIYDTHFFCPAGGQYESSPDGHKVSCTVHGSALAPQQPVRLVEDTALGRFMKEFEMLTMTLTFLEDGLHAVVTIDRK